MNNSLRNNLLKGLGFFMIFLFLMALLQHFESEAEDGSILTFFDAFWYSIVTLTTVGYGDTYPVTFYGKIVGLIMILLSLGLLTYVLGLITRNVQEYMEKKKMGHYGTNYTDHIVIIGWNEFAEMIADQILKAHYKVVIITDDKNSVDLIHEMYEHKDLFVVFGDYKSDESFDRANILKATSVLINGNEDSETLVNLINLRRKYKDLNVVIAARNTDLKETFYTAGATYVVSEHEISTRLIASFVFEPDVAKFTEDLMTTATDNESFDIFELQLKADNDYVGRAYFDAFVELKRDYNVVLIGLCRKIGSGYELLKNPSNDLQLAANDYMIMVADGYTKHNIEEKFGVREGRFVR